MVFETRAKEVSRSITRVRPGRPEETQALYEVWRASVVATHDFLTPEDLEFYAEMVRGQYLPEADLVVAVDGDDRPVGFRGVTGNNVDTLFVHPDWRGRGVGRLLLEQALEAADGPVLVDVNEQNGQAAGFYERMGFRKTGRSETDQCGKPYPLAHMQRD